MKHRLKPKKLTPLEETYLSMKDAAHRHGTKFDLTFEEWLPIWAKLDQAWKANDRKVKLGAIHD
jgi:hypothetical protein